MSAHLILLYTSIAFFYTLSPGPAVFLAISNGITQNMKAVVSSSLGNVCGLFILSGISILGLGTLLLTSAVLFTIVKVIGALYLVYLGIKQFKQSRHPKALMTDKTNKDKASYFKLFLQSFVVAATNPKPILFFVALFPQFLVMDSPLLPQFLILTGIFMAWSFTILCTYGYISHRANFLFSKQSVMTWFHRVTGGIFISMGAALIQLKGSN